MPMEKLGARSMAREAAADFRRQFDQSRVAHGTAQAVLSVAVLALLYAACAAALLFVAALYGAALFPGSAAAGDLAERLTGSEAIGGLVRAVVMWRVLEWGRQLYAGGVQ